jgi:hypothetical protein
MNGRLLVSALVASVAGGGPGGGHAIGASSPATWQ